MASNNSTTATFAKRIFGFSMASWVNCLISLISTPITTALFLPAELGKINMFISFANVLIPFIYLGFDQAYVRFYHEPCGKNTAHSLFRVCLLISSISAVLVGGVVLVAWKYFSANIIGYSSMGVAVCLVLYLIATMLLRYANLRARMENNIWLFFVQSVVSTIIIKLSFAAIALVSPNSRYAIAVRSVLLTVAGVIFVVLVLFKKPKEQADFSKPVLVDLSKFALPVFPTAFLVMLNLSLSQLMLKQYVDYTMIGIYSNAVTIAGIITIVQSGLNTFWTPFVYEYYKDREKVQQMHHIVAFLMLCMALGIVLFQDVIYWVLVDRQYWASKAIMAFLLIGPISDTISETLGLGIELSKKTYWKIPIYVINIVVNFVSCIVLIPRFGVLGAAMANALASLSMLMVKSVIGERFYRCSNTYYRLVLGMCLVLGNAFVNYYYPTGWLKVITSGIGLVLVCCLYWKTLRILLTKTLTLSKKFFRRSIG